MKKHDEDPAAFCLYKWKGSDSAGWSYLNADGYAATGWFEIGDQWYFSDENGSLLTNTVTRTDIVWTAAAPGYTSRNIRGETNYEKTIL